MPSVLRATVGLALLCFASCATSPHERLLAEIAAPAAWTITDVQPGVQLWQRWFPSLFGAPQSLSALVVDPDAEVAFDLAVPQMRTVTSELGERTGALAAINGGYFAIDGDGRSLGLLREDGVLVVPANEAQASVGIDARGRLHLATRAAGDWPEMVDALGAGPMLLVDGARVEPEGARSTRRHPRSAVGLRADGGAVWLAIDGRMPKATGATFAETATVLQAFGCVQGLNLDGGGSTSLWVAPFGVCSFPCDDKVYDHAGERRVANALLLRDARRAGGGGAREPARSR